MSKRQQDADERLPVGVEWRADRPYAYCNSLKWGIRPLAHTKQTTDIVRKAVASYEESMRAVLSGKMMESERLVIYEDASKTILEATLESFDEPPKGETRTPFSYDDVANDPEAGPGLLGKLAIEIKDFLFAGGAGGMRLLQTQSDTMSGISSRTSRR